MALIDRIPMVGNPMDAFMTGMQQSNAMFDSIANRKLAQGRLEVERQNAEVAKQTAARAQTMLPYLIQQYQDAHNLAPAQKRHLEAQINQEQAAYEKAMSDLRFNNQIDQMAFGGNKGQGTMPSTPNMQTNQIGKPQQIPASSSPFMDTSNLNRKQLVDIANQDQAQADASRQGNVISGPQISPGQSPQMTPNPPSGPEAIAGGAGAEPAPQTGMEPQAAPPSSSMPPQGVPSDTEAQQPAASVSKFQQGGSDNNYISPDVVIKPPRPGMEILDNLAGLDVHGRNFKPPKLGPVVDGMQETEWPSGKVTKRKVGPTYAEKQIEALQTYDAKKLADMNRKDSSDIEKSAKSLIAAQHNLHQINDLLTTNPKLTSGWYGAPMGIGPGIAKAFGSEELGNFDSATGMMQANYAKSETNRPGIGMVKFFERTKPDKANNVKYNLGMVKSLNTKNEAEFNDMKSEWEAKNPGKSFPYKFEPIGQSEKDRLTKLANDAIASNPAKKDEILAKLANLTKEL